MLITVNGQALEAAAGITGAGLLAQLGIPPHTAVAEVNGCIVPRERFIEQILADGDVIELVTLVGGG